MALSPSEIDAIADFVKPFTMSGRAGIEFAIEQAVKAIELDVPGDFAECGVWKGGVAMAIAMAQRAAFGSIKRPVHLFDSFKGLPPAEPIDGPGAAAYQAATTSPFYFDNCRADEGELIAQLELMGFSEGEVFVHAGDFADTFPNFHGSLALLRIDCDWFASVKLCLAKMAARVSTGGIVIVDDYYAWDGAARALHEWLAIAGPYRLETIGDRSGVFFVKEDFE